ncbi:MAG: serine/threonine-protein kinase, partial [Planctomycetota bacterium]
MTLARNEQDQERLIALVREALAQIDAGKTVDARALCGEHPHLAAPLAEVLGLQDQLPLLQQVALRDDPLAGAVLAGRYRLTTCLGRGAMGVVYEGEDQELRRGVAVKILDVRLFRDPDAERRFQREAEALAALQHRHVVAVFDRGRTPEGIHYLVMERLQGCTLARLLDRIDEGAAPLAAVAEVAGGPPPDQVWPRLVARWGHDLACGLAVAHERGLVHRDVKPSNIFLAGAERAVLLDFGIAARLTEDRLTATATTLGTPWYMAPEQVRAGGVGAAAPAVDVYGLGASLFHLLAGRSPYEGDAAAVLAALPVRDPPLLISLRPGLP